MPELDHPALRHPGLTTASLRQRADAEAAAVLDRAVAIAAARIAREEAAQRALAALQLESQRPVSDPWQAAARLRPGRWLGSPDLTLALTLHFAASAPTAESEPPQLGPARDLDREGWQQAVEDARAGWDGLQVASLAPLPLMRPWSHRWATFLDQDPDVRLGVAHLVAALEPEGLWRFTQTRAYADGLETHEEVVAAARAAFTAAAGTPFPLEAPPLRITPAATPDPGPAHPSPLRPWLCDWLTWETRLGLPIELATYLGAGLAALDRSGESDVFDEPAACATLCHLVGVRGAQVTLPAALAGTEGEPRLGLADIFVRRAQSVLFKLRQGQTPDARRDPDLVGLGLPVLAALQAADALLTPAPPR